MSTKIVESGTNETFEQMVEVCGGDEVLAVDMFCQNLTLAQARRELQGARFRGGVTSRFREGGDKTEINTRPEEFWQAVEAQMTETGCGKGDAVRFVVSERPELHEAFLREKEDDAAARRSAR